MKGSHRQDIIELLVGRSMAAPDVFSRQQWRGWLDAGRRPGSTRRDAMLQWLLQHPRSPGQASQGDAGWLAHWWAVLGRQMAERPPRDLRALRGFAALSTLALHLGFAVLLVWVALVRSMLPPSQEEQRTAVRFVSAGHGEGSTGGTAQVPGEGNPDGALPGPRPAAAQASPEKIGPGRAEVQPLAEAAPDAGDAGLAAPPLVAIVQPGMAARAMQVLPMPEVPVVEREVANVPPAVPVRAPQAVAVQPSLAMPDIAVRERELPVVEPSVRPVVQPVVRIEPRAVDRPLQVVEVEVAQVQAAPTPSLPQPRIGAVRVPGPEVTVIERRVDPALRERIDLTSRVRPAGVAMTGTLAVAAVPPAVPEREVEVVASAPAVVMPRLLPHEPALRGQDAAVPTVRQREVALRSSPAAGQMPVAAAMPRSQQAGRSDSMTAAVAATASASASVSQSQSQSPSADGGGGGGISPQPAVAGTAGTPAAAVPPGAAPGGVAGADWSSGRGNDEWARAGGKGGSDLFDTQGRPRLPGEAPPARGAPGSHSDGWTRERLAASGTWLKRPPYEHRPTSFDRYWVPNESLLAEWVRKGVRSIAIPVPGTNTSIECVISVLQFGGGCGLSNPDMQLQPAQARAAPDIPFKPALQQDNGSP